MMKRDLIIKIALDEAEQALFRGRMALVVPVSEDEGIQLATDMITLHEDLARLSTEVEAVIGTTEHHGQELSERTITAVLTPWPNQIEELCGRMDRVRQLIGRGTFVQEGDGKPKRKAVLQ